MKAVEGSWLYISLSIRYSCICTFNKALRICDKYFTLMVLLNHSNVVIIQVDESLVLRTSVVSSGPSLLAHTKILKWTKDSEQIQKLDKSYAN